MRLYIDFETRSPVDLKKSGAYKYARHPATTILCAAWAVKTPGRPTSRPYIWWPYIGERGYMNIGDSTTEMFIKALKKSDTIHAHNAEFDRVIYDQVMPRLNAGFPEIPLEKWRCTAAKIAYHALPRRLEHAAEALELIARKDMGGHKVMLKWSKGTEDPLWSRSEEAPINYAAWDPSRKAEFDQLCRYCKTDIEVTCELDSLLPDLPETEEVTYQLDQRINETGFCVDTQSIKRLVSKVELEKTRILSQVAKLTGGRLRSTRQRDAFLMLLKEEHGVKLPSLRQEQVAAILKTPEKLPETALKLLKLHQSLSKTSVAKLNAALASATDDNRIQSTFLYHAATTGRWGGKNFQPQNLPRESFQPSDVRKVIKLSNKNIRKKYGNVLPAVSKCLRGMIVAPKEKKLYVLDFGQIEGRGLAFLAGETAILIAYRQGVDQYKVTASRILNKPLGEITKEDRGIGKVIELACGYQGSVGAVRRFGAKELSKLSDSEVLSLVMKWRKYRKNTVSFWYNVERAAVATVQAKQPHMVGSLRFEYIALPNKRHAFLRCRLPSGRALHYYQPKIEEGRKFSFYNPKIRRQDSTYGGALTENITQGLCRDILRDALLRMNFYFTNRIEGFKIVGHVHDEIIVEGPDFEGDIDKQKKALDFLNQLICAKPKWLSSDFPIVADGWVDSRYHK